MRAVQQRVLDNPDMKDRGIIESTAIWHGVQARRQWRTS
jgi:hypothetical protein